MTLGDYLTKRGYGAASELALKLGLTRACVAKLRSGGKPRMSTAMKIVVATGGAVSLEDLAHAVVSSNRDGRAPAVATGAAL